MPNVFVAYYPFDTLDVIPTLSESDKIAQLTEQVAAASANMRMAATHMKLADWIGFFAVPEYYFLKSHRTVGKTTTTELYTETERDAIFGRLVSLSDQFNRVVLLPGTLTWSRKLGAPRTVTRGSKPTTVNFEGRSTAPVFFAGDIVHTYEKVMNDGVVDTTVADTVYVPGTASPLFSIGSLRCGFEICGDFNERNLSRATAPQSLDFEFMLSGSNFHNFQQVAAGGVPVRNGGYFLHVDQAPKKAAAYNGVWCVSRGSGWHSVDTSAHAAVIYDPWTLREVRSDMLGQQRSVGHVIAVAMITKGYQPTSGVALPGTRAFSGLKLGGRATLTGPLDAHTGAYEVTVTADLMADPGSTSPIDDRSITFSADGAIARTKTVRTDATGKASCVFVCRKDREATLTATFHNAKLTFEARLVWLGPGDVTKISPLKAMPHGDVPTYLTPVM